jgi:hypothetical protein
MTWRLRMTWRALRKRARSCWPDRYTQITSFTGTKSNEVAFANDVASFEKARLQLLAGQVHSDY